MEYRSIAELNERIVDWAAELPVDIQLVVGIPRSGMLAANLLALHLHLPLTDLEGLCSGRVMLSGDRGVPQPDTGQRLSVLVVDDSVCSGASMDAARARIASADLPHSVRFGAVFVTPEAVREGKVALFAEAVPMPRAFEWNILHTEQIRRYCVALEDVLCRFPDGSGQDRRDLSDGFPRGVQPHFRPSHRIGWIVTSRSEASRGRIEQWLADRGVAYDELVTAGDGAQSRSEARFKAAVYRETAARVFVEHEAERAAAIARLARRPVFALATRTMVYPDDYPRQRHVPVRVPSSLELAARSLARLPRRMVDRLRRSGRSARRASATPLEPR